MEINRTNISPALIIGLKDEKDYAILGINKETITFESADKLDDEFRFTILLFNFSLYDYEKFEIDKCKVLQVKENEFSYIYICKIEEIKNLEEYETKLKDLLKAVELNDMSYTLDNIFKDNNEKKLQLKDNSFFNNYEEQHNYWFNENTNCANNQFSSIINDVELAFNVNNYILYNQFLIKPFNDAIKEELEKNKLSNHGIFQKEFSRVYIGNQFCHNLFPDNEMLFKLINKAKDENYKISIAFTYMRDNHIDTYRNILGQLSKWCDENKMEIEIIVNDWGMLNIVNKDFNNNFTISLGILLNKRKKDPRMKWKIGSDKFIEARKENNLNCGHFYDFLEKHNITRFEFESHVEMNKIPEGKHSLNFPFYQMNTSQYCTLYAECQNYSRDIQKLVENCPRYCEEFVCMLPKNLDAVGKGNSLFGFDNSILINPQILSEYRKMGIDRLLCTLL